MAETDWTKVFEAMSLAKARLRQAPGYGFRDPQRLPQRHRGLARGLRPADVAASELRLAGAACQASPDPGRVLIGPQRQAFETTQGFRPGLGLRLCRLRFGLTGPQDLTRMLRRLEVHHLSSIGGAVHDALLSDGPESDTEVTATDRALISKAQAGIAALNAT